MESKIGPEIIGIVSVLLVIAIVAVAWRYVGKHMMYTQTEAEEEANLKRLFGDAWRKAKDL